MYIQRCNLGLLKRLALSVVKPHRFAGQRTFGGPWARLSSRVLVKELRVWDLVVDPTIPSP